MIGRRFRNRVREWRYAVLVVAACLLSARFVENGAGTLDRLSDSREQALQDLEAVQNHLTERRGRYATDSNSLRAALQLSLTDRAIEELFPGLVAVARDTHAGLLLHLEPAQDRGR